MVRQPVRARRVDVLHGTTILVGGGLVSSDVISQLADGISGFQRKARRRWVTVKNWWPEWVLV